MKKTFTKILTALALLVFMTPSLAGWGQVTWERVTSISTLTSGGTFIMGYEATANSGIIIPLRSADCNATTSANGFFNTGTTSNNSTNGTITMSNLSGVTTSDYEVYITGITVENNSNYINIQRTNSSGNYYGATSGGTSSNKGRLYTSGNSNETNLLLEWSNETYNQFKLTANVSGSYKYLKYNTGSPRFAFYNSVGEKIVFYKKVSSGPTITNLSYTGTPTTTTYEAGDSFDPTGLTVTATYSDASTQDVTASVEWTPDPLTVGTTEVTGTYSGKTITIGSLVVNAVPDPDIVLDKDNTPFSSSTATNTTETVTLNNIVYENYGGYNFNNYLSIKRDIEGYLGNNTELCGNIKKIVIDYATSGGAAKFTMYEGSTALSETSTVSPSSTTGTGDVTYTFSGNNGYFKFKRTTTGSQNSDYVNINSIKIYLYDCGPTISANAVTIPYDATSGSIAYTINNEPAPAGTMTSAAVTASNPSGWLTVSSTLDSPIGLTCEANNTFTERTATVRLTYTYNTNETIIKDVTVTQAASPYTLTVALSDHVNGIYVFNAANQSEPLIAEGLEGNALVPGGTEILVSPDIAAGYRLQSLMVGGTDVTSLMSGDSYTFTMNNHVTITATAEILPCYTVTLCDDNSTLTEASYGAGITLPSRDNTNTYTFAGWSLTNVGGTETTTAPTTIIPAGSYSPSANTILYPVYTRSTSGTPTTGWQLIALSAVQANDVCALVADDNKAFSGEITTNQQYSGHGGTTSNAFVFDTDGYATTVPDGICEITFTSVTNGYAMYNASYGYLYAKENSTGNLDWHPSESSYWKVSQNGQWTYRTSGNADAYLRSYVSTGANIPTTFRTYGNITSSSATLKLAKKVIVTPTVTYYTSLLSTYTLSVNGYGSDNTVKTGWNLIASPASVNPSYVENMTSNTFDLYRFNGTANKEWENWKQEEGDHYHFGLVPGKGYLYAHSGETVNLTFTGTMATSIADVVLPYDSDSDIKSLYLAGNSLQAVTTFYVYDDQLNKKTVNFLTINEYGDGFITTPTAAFKAGAMQGFFVQSGGADWTLSTTDLDDAKSGNVELLNVKVSRNRGTLVDNAIVSFGNAPQMSKFYLFDNTTRVFIPQNGEEMAVVLSEAQGEMPVNFRAAENGSYTLTVSPEDVEMNYLHLIDNMTGADVDLLATPSYTFSAKSDDYASRFRLVFSANNANNTEIGNDNFAFISNGQIVLTEQGNARVYDITGRLISSHNNVSHITTEGMANGVYVLQLVNGIDVKTQKIVVK